MTLRRFRSALALLLALPPLAGCAAPLAEPAPAAEGALSIPWEMVD